MLAFFVNKGGIYYSAQASEAAQRVPGFFFIGETDLEFRNDIIAGCFAYRTPFPSPILSEPRDSADLWTMGERPRHFTSC